jgi:hypothetical protein
LAEGNIVGRKAHGFAQMIDGVRVRLHSVASKAVESGREKEKGMDSRGRRTRGLGLGLRDRRRAHVGSVICSGISGVCRHRMLGVPGGGEKCGALTRRRYKERLENLGF